MKNKCCEKCIWRAEDGCIGCVNNNCSCHQSGGEGTLCPHGAKEGECPVLICGNAPQPAKEEKCEHGNEKRGCIACYQVTFPQPSAEEGVAYGEYISEVRRIVTKYFNEYPNKFLVDLAQLLKEAEARGKKDSWLLGTSYVKEQLAQARLSAYAEIEKFVEELSKEKATILMNAGFAGPEILFTKDEVLSFIKENKTKND